MPPLPTHDFAGVDIMAVGGPYFGVGSPPEGDFFTEETLREYASTMNALAGEVRGKIKLGHSKAQALLANSGLVDESGAPAAGWLENYRVEAGKLLVDLKKVPAKLARLVESGAFGRTRSVELRSYTSPVTKKSYKVIDALAFLGGKSPAVRNLDDIAALYEAGPNLRLDGDPDDGVRVVEYEVAEQDARLAPIQESSMPNLTITPEQAKVLAAKLGVTDAKDLSPERLLEAAEALAGKVPATDELKKRDDEIAALKGEVAKLTAAGGGTEGEAAEALAKRITDLEAAAADGTAAKEQLRVMTRDADITTAVREFRIKPSEREQYARDYDAAPDVTRGILARLPVDEELRKVYGADGARADLDHEPADADEASREFETLMAGYYNTVGIDNPNPPKVTA